MKRIATLDAMHDLSELLSEEFVSTADFDRIGRLGRIIGRRLNVSREEAFELARIYAS